MTKDEQIQFLRWLLAEKQWHELQEHRRVWHVDLPLLAVKNLFEVLIPEGRVTVRQMLGTPRWFTAKVETAVKDRWTPEVHYYNLSLDLDLLETGGNW